MFAQKCNPKNGKITLENAKFLDEEILNKYDESDFINKNDIIINSTGNGTLGRIGIIDEERIFLNKIVVDSHVTLIRINKNYINPYYIFYLLKTYQRYLESQASGSTNQTELSPEVIKKLLIPLPCTNEQNGIISKINSLLNLI
ncbi:MAG: restriction endonuclease subunit S [Clostridia bacterium]|nr:restriction endonuclease subunit S [Clostridia bacterium]